MKMSRLILISVLFLAIAGAAMFAWVHRTPRQPRFDFFGLVIDETGRPVHGAEVLVSWVRVEKSGRPISGTEQQRTFQTDASGRFEIRGEVGDGLQVMRIAKPGYEWVHEVFMSTETAPTKLTDNRFYGFGKFGYTYLPDSSRPAIFPLFREGSNAVGKPSRGGADRYPDGRVVVNDPLSPAIPTAGYGAPKTQNEREERWRSLATQRTATQKAAQ